MPSPSPGDQDHTGHLRRAGVVLLLIGGRANAPTPSPHPGAVRRVSGACWPQALLLAFHPSLGNAIFSFIY